MAEVTIGQLAPLTPLNATDVLEAQRGDGGGYGKVTVQQIVDETLSQLPSSSVVWGQITGTLSNQTDLQNALNGKANSGAENTAVWGQITGTLSAQTDLQSALNTKADQATTYTKAEVDALLAGKLNTTGGTITGTLTVTGNIVSNADIQAFQP